MQEYLFPPIAIDNVMPASASMPPPLVADDVALDFLNSICAPKGQWIEWLADGQGLLHWMVEAGLISADDKNWFATRYDPSQLNEMAQKARQLREDFRHFIHASFYDPHPGSADNLDNDKAQDFGFINSILEKDCSHDVMIWDADQRIFTLTGQYKWQKLDDLLQPLAKAMAYLICETDITRIKNCDNPPCSLWFSDISKNGKRRWCSMAVCGNRHKASLHRKKKA